MIVYEPVTFITDVMVSVLCFYFVRRTKTEEEEPVLLNWRYFFLFMGISTFLGGLVHGFFPFHDTLAGQLVWGASHMLSSVTLFFAQSTAVCRVRTNKLLYRFLLSLMYVQLLLTFIAIVFVQNFGVMIISLAIGYLPLLIFYIVRALRGEIASRWISLGILLSLSTGVVFLAKFSFCEWFNFNDIAHMIFLLGFTAIFQGLQPPKAQDLLTS